MKEGKFVQAVRLADVFLVTPVLLYTARKEKKGWLKTSLYTLGISTALYNGYNFIKNIK